MPLALMLSSMIANDDAMTARKPVTYSIASVQTKYMRQTQTIIYLNSLRSLY